MNRFVAGALALVLPLVACSSEPPGEEGAASVEERADGLGEASCAVSATVSADVQATVDDVYDYVVRQDTPARDLRRFVLIPGVRGDRLLTPGAWDHPGARRFVFLDDGARCVEELDRLDRPNHFEYHSSDYSFPLGLLIAGARGTWTFASTLQGHTTVTWTYTFTPRSCAKESELRVLVQTMFRPYMEQAMASIARHVEAT